MEFTIRNRFTETVIFEAKAESFKLAIEAAVQSKVSLRSADLRSANLRFADLSSANLRSVNLSSADLRSEDLSSADLSSANLRSADLRSADLPARTNLLQCLWGRVSESLCADLMMFDAAAHSDPALFQAWVDGGLCPYDNEKFQRAANFEQSREAWGKGTGNITPTSLLVRLFAENNIKV